MLKTICLCRNLRREFILSIKFKAIDSPDLKYIPDIWLLHCYLISVPLYTIFKDLVFRSLCLVPNIYFVLSCPKRLLNLLSANQSHFLKNFWLVSFQFQFNFYVRKLYKYHQHKVTSHWQQLGASHLCKVETGVDLK